MNTPQPQQPSSIQKSNGAQKTQMSNLKGLFERALPSLAKVAPKYFDVERLYRIAFNTISRNKKLAECTQDSLLNALMEAAQEGLEIGLAGEAYLVPYRNNKRGCFEAQMQRGYHGLAKLARQSGVVSNIEAEVVYEGDDFTYRKGLEPVLDHTPCPVADRGEIRGAYCIVRFKPDSGYRDQATFCPVEDIESEHRARSRSKDDGPWISDFPAMCRKTAVRVSLNLVPKSRELERALRREDRDEGVEGVEADDLPLGELDAPTEPSTRTQALKEKIGAGKKEDAAADTQAADDGAPPKLDQLCALIREHAQAARWPEKTIEETVAKIETVEQAASILAGLGVHS